MATSMPAHFLPPPLTFVIRSCNLAAGIVNLLSANAGCDWLSANHANCSYPFRTSPSSYSGCSRGSQTRRRPLFPLSPGISWRDDPGTHPGPKLDYKYLSRTQNLPGLIIDQLEYRCPTFLSLADVGPRGPSG